MRNVAPHAGAWIETAALDTLAQAAAVAPHAGAWIETLSVSKCVTVTRVAPHAGAWIETIWAVSEAVGRLRRAPRGRVD